MVFPLSRRGEDRPAHRFPRDGAPRRARCQAVFDQGDSPSWRAGEPHHGSAAKEAAIKSYNAEHGTAIAIRQIKYLHNMVEQDHRAVKRITRPMLGCKSCAAAQATRVGVELMHLIKQRQLGVEEGAEGRTAAEQFYSLAA